MIAEPKDADAVDPERALQRILELERALRRTLEEHEREARRVVKQAREQTRERGAASGERERQALAGLRHRIEIQRDAELERIEARAEAEESRYRNLPPERIEALADWVVEQLLEADRDSETPA